MLLPSPYGFQERGAELLTKGPTYLMWDMGVGKTLTCILAMKKLGMPVIVLAPLNAALLTWPEELDKWAPDLSYVVLHGPNKRHLARQCKQYDVVILNFEGLYWWMDMATKGQLNIHPKYFVIWDESSLLKDYNTQRWNIMASANPIWSKYRVCLSGTPMPNKIQDLWAQYYLLDQGRRLMPDYYQFLYKWFDVGDFANQATIKKGADWQIYNRIKDITDRLDGDDYLELPKTVHNDIYLELPSNLLPLYEELVTEFVVQFPEGVVEANSSAVLESKLAQFMQGAMYLKDDIGMKTTSRYKVINTIKAEALRSLVEQANGSPILAPVQYQFEYDIISQVMGYTVPSINGSTPTKRKQYLKDMWNKRQIPLLLVHPRTCAYSLNLQFGGHTIVWVALPWEMDLYNQLIRRLRRQGQKSDRVIVHRLMFKDTVDEKKASVLARKDGNQQQLFDAVRKERHG